MNKILIFLSITIFASCSSIQIPKEDSKFIINRVDTNEILKLKNNILINGYISNGLNYSISQNIVNIGLTDSVFYYKYIDKDTFDFIPVKPIIFDINREDRFSIIPTIKNIDSFDFNIDEWLLTKLSDHDRTYSSFYNKSPIYVSKGFFKYDNNSFSKNGSTNISFSIMFQIKPNFDPLLFKIIEYALEERKNISDICYIDSFPKQLTINKIELQTGLFGEQNLSFSPLLRWDFIETKYSNYLIVYFSSHTNIPIKSQYSLKVYGRFSNN